MPVSVDQHHRLTAIGQNLQRPECVVAHASGLLLVPNWLDNGGISLINADSGHTEHLFSTAQNFKVRPNGIALEADGGVLLAHLGDSDGGIFRLSIDGTLQPVVLTADGEPLPPTNFVVCDTHGNLWITVSTRVSPRHNDYRRHAASGFVAVARPGSTDARIVADQLGYTNECVIDAARGVVYVNETFGRRVTRFDLQYDGSANPTLSNRHVIATLGPGVFPDGVALAEDGSLWVTSIVSNQILHIWPDGNVSTFLKDADSEHVAWVEAAYEIDAMSCEHLTTTAGKQLKNISNLAFGGTDRMTLFIGNLRGTEIHHLPSDSAGAAMPHWSVPLGDLQRYVD